MKKRIVIVFTGGTISMEIDESMEAAVPSKKGEALIKRIQEFSDIAELSFDHFLSVPSPYISISDMLSLSRRVKSHLADPNTDGVIITHGTDTMEETAYFLDLNIHNDKPIILVGSMRNISELGYDGPSNLVAALRTAISDEAKGRGVLVVMNNDINAANEVMKTHTMALDTFKSLEFGPLGIVDHDKVIFYRNSTHRRLHIPADRVEERVFLIKLAAGMDGELIDYAVNQKAKGIVIEALGRGNVPSQVVPSIKRAIEEGIYVILVSRCPMGRIADTYGYVGGSKHLKSLGVIFGYNLSGQKARIQLMLGLGYRQDPDYIRSIFEME